jgi:hypothetical protein
VIECNVVTAIGHPFSLVIDDMPSSGHVWSCTRRPSEIELLRVSRETPNKPEELTFLFVALSVGEFTVGLELKRPWESVPADELNVRVRAIEG